MHLAGGRSGPLGCGPLVRIALLAAAGGLVLASCASESSGSTDSGSRSADSQSTAATPGATTENGSTEDCEPASQEPIGDHDSGSVDLEPVGRSGDVSVSAALYPLPEGEGNPWSQWGQGVVLPDGRFVSAVGDHLGRDGTSWMYEFDPQSNRLTRTTEVGQALGHVEGDWGYGKVHAQLLLSRCGDVLGSTYWGTRDDLVTGGSYNGDHIFEYDPSTRGITSLGVPIDGYGLPSLALSPDKRWIFGEAVDPTSSTEDDTGKFFVAEADSGEVTFVVDDVEHVGFRSILVDAAGHAFFSSGGGTLQEVDPENETVTEWAGVLPGDWLRASTSPSVDGSTFGATREPDALFRRGSNGDFVDLGELEDYVASLALSPDGRTLYYIPGAHGSGWEYGTPLVAVDVETGTRTTLVLLNDLIEPALGVRVGGTYNIVADPSGERLYVGLNAGSVEDDDEAFGQVVLAAVDLG